MRRLLPLLLSVLPLLGVLPLLDAVAAPDTRAVDLPLASGDTLRGVVESADNREVVVRTGPDAVRRIPWNRLQPVSVYRVKAALAPPAEGPARLALAEMAVEFGLYREARVEYEKALALGAIDRKSFQKVVFQAEQDAVEAGVARALTHAKSGDFEAAMQAARDLKLHFGGAPNARAIDRLVKQLLAQVSKLEKESARDARELEKLKLDTRRNKEILRRKTEASGLIEKGKAFAKQAAAVRVIGNVTRARKFAESADKAFMDARRHFGRLRRIIPPEDPMYREVLAKLNDLDGLQFDVLFQTAWFFWEGRIYSKAGEFAARASFIDPVHPDLLDLREMLRASRIRYRLSDVTNARPIIR